MEIGDWMKVIVYNNALKSQHKNLIKETAEQVGADVCFIESEDSIPEEFEDAEIFYTQHYSFENNKDVSELAKSIGLDPDQVRELVIKNRKKIVPQAVEEKSTGKTALPASDCFFVIS